MTQIYSLDYLASRANIKHELPGDLLAEGIVHIDFYTDWEEEDCSFARITPPPDEACEEF
jgi:hypothetical protein